MKEEESGEEREEEEMEMAIDVIHEIQNSSLKDKPILIYTGTVEKVDLKMHGDAGNVIGVLAKPFEMNSFVKILKSIKHRN